MITAAEPALEGREEPMDYVNEDGLVPWIGEQADLDSDVVR